MVECESHLKTYSKVDKCVLIDTWWNVNLAFGSEVSTEVPVLIDTWWNVNDDTVKICYGNENVLIDTWWNVNQYKNISRGWSVYVLIDTWWNVNKTTDTKNCRWCKCFNRYMVECE